MVNFNTHDKSKNSATAHRADEERYATFTSSFKHHTWQREKNKGQRLTSPGGAKTNVEVFVRAHRS